MGSYPPDSTDECIVCEGDLWYDNDYNGGRLLKSSEWMCKVCERIALEEGTHERIDIVPPRGWIWIARALPYATASISSIICLDWTSVEAVVDAEKYEWGVIEEDVQCVGNVIVLAMHDNYELDYLEHASFKKALEHESSVWIFVSAQDREGVRVKGGRDICESLLDEIQLALVRNKNARIFIASQDADSDLAHTSWRRYFYQGMDACRWYRSREECKEAWLAEMEWWQYALQEVEQVKKKKRL